METIRRIRNRVGRRGAFLLFLAVLDGVFAWYLFNPPIGSPPQPFLLLPPQTWGAWWGCTGIVCATGAFMTIDRVPYALAALLKTAWGLRFAYLWYSGVSQSWAAMTIWLVFALIVIIVSGWPEEAKIPPQGGR